MNKLIFAADHGAIALKAELIDYAKTLGYHCEDLGTNDQGSVDYPDYAHKLCETLKNNSDYTGVLLCGSGIGMSMAANRHSHIYAALCHDVTTARLCREHNNANVLVMGERTTGLQVAKDILKTFLETSFTHGRHENRVKKINI